MSYFLSIILLSAIVIIVTCQFTTFTALNAVVFTDVLNPQPNVHSEYYFGKCANKERTLLFTDHYTYEDLQGYLIIRKYVYNISDTPNCVYIRAKSPYADMLKYKSYKFSICYGSVVNNYNRQIWINYFYEWYIPVEMHPDIEWDLFFYLA